MSIAMAGLDWECEEHPEHCNDELMRSTLDDYNDFTNFSLVAVESEIHENILRAAAELGKAHAHRIERLVTSMEIL